MDREHLDSWLEHWTRRALGGVSPNSEQAIWLRILGAQMAAEVSLARRVALVEVLLDGRPHQREDLWTAVEERLGKSCFGAHPEQTLWTDIRTLRRWGLRIGYTRMSGLAGYYLEYPPLTRTEQPQYEEETSSLQVETYRSWDNQRKMQSMFEMFDLAMHRARMGARARHPDWDDDQVEAEARQLVTRQPLTRVVG